jgi:hypothetical protein
VIGIVPLGWERIAQEISKKAERTASGTR